MRRLAKQSRDDTYSSVRDYQTLHTRKARRFVPNRGTTGKLVLDVRVKPDRLGLVCWGAYLRSPEATILRVELAALNDTSTCTVPLDHRWRRAGSLLSGVVNAREVTLTLRWDRRPIDVWGLALGRPAPPTKATNEVAIALLRQSHLVPETFYLPHDTSVDAELEAEESRGFRTIEGSDIELKKCSYCGRLLPVDSQRLGALAFHKHRAKVTKHQNECRACKKWRINDSFNPIRSVDQLHESSVITRERKLFLREPEILQEMKERTGEGLKSKVWKRFDKQCFRCGRAVKLSEFQLDHTRPLAYLWPIDEYATCLCAECNNEKKEKFPVDFYNAQQLRALSEITGLPLGVLKQKSVNEIELQRILKDLPRFARDWEPRTFAATARKVQELRPEINLLMRLRAVDAGEYARLVRELAERPPPLDEE